MCVVFACCCVALAYCGCVYYDTSSGFKFGVIACIVVVGVVFVILFGFEFGDLCSVGFFSCFRFGVMGWCFCGCFWTLCCSRLVLGLGCAELSVVAFYIGLSLFA